MPSLREVQARFAAALFAEPTLPEAAAAWSDLVLERDVSAREGLGVYRNNLREGFRKALALEFPVIVRLVGDDYFRQLAGEFLASHPSRSGDLHHVGRPFPAYLEERFAGTEYRYFADVARLEWAYCEALIAAHAEPLAPDGLAVVPPERYADLVFEIAPDCRLVSSPYPIRRIWQANQAEATEAAPDAAAIDLSAGGDRLLVRRGPGGVEFRALDEPTCAFLHAVELGLTLEAAFAAAGQSDPAFDLAATLQRMVALGILVRFSLATAAKLAPPESR